MFHFSFFIEDVIRLLFHLTRMHSCCFTTRSITTTAFKPILVLRIEVKLQLQSKMNALRFRRLEDLSSLDKRWKNIKKQNLYQVRHDIHTTLNHCLVGCLCLLALWDSISIYMRPSPRQKEKEKRNDRSHRPTSVQHPYIELTLNEAMPYRYTVAE